MFLPLSPKNLKLVLLVSEFANLQHVILYMGNDIFTTQNETKQKKINETKTKSLTETLEKRVKYVQN